MEALKNTSVAFADELKYFHPKNMTSPPPLYLRPPAWAIYRIHSSELPLFDFHQLHFQNQAPC